jgi:hypothetical protein
MPEENTGRLGGVSPYSLAQNSIDRRISMTTKSKPRTFAENRDRSEREKLEPRKIGKKHVFPSRQGAVHIETLPWIHTTGIKSALDQA